MNAEALPTLRCSFKLFRINECPVESERRSKLENATRPENLISEQILKTSYKVLNFMDVTHGFVVINRTLAIRLRHTGKVVKVLFNGENIVDLLNG